MVKCFLGVLNFSLQHNLLHQCSAKKQNDFQLTVDGHNLSVNVTMEINSNCRCLECFLSESNLLAYQTRPGFSKTFVSAHWKKNWNVANMIRYFRSLLDIVNLFLRWSDERENLITKHRKDVILPAFGNAMLSFLSKVDLYTKSCNLAYRFISILFSRKLRHGSSI